MNDIRKLIESLERIDEGFFSELDMELKDLYSRNPEVTPVQVVGHLRKVMGAEAAKYMSDQFERGTFDSSSYMQEEAGDIEYLQYPEGHKPAPAPEKHILDKYTWTMYLDNEVLSMMDSFIHKMKSQNIWDKGVELAGGEEELLRSIQYEAEDVVESYRGSGDGIGTSDINHFVRSIFRDLGEDDIWGWDKPKEGLGEDDWSDFDTEMDMRIMQADQNLRDFGLKSDDEMERDKTNRYAKYNKAIRGREGLGEGFTDWVIKKTAKYSAKQAHKMVQELGPDQAADTIAFDNDKTKADVIASLDLYLQLEPEGEYAESVRYLLPAITKHQEKWDDMWDDVGKQAEKHLGIGIDEENSDTALAPYEDEENWMGKSVRITGGKHRGETGKVTNIDRYRDEEGMWQMVYTVKLYSGGEPVKLYPSEWGFDQLELEFGEGLGEDSEVFKRKVQNPDWRDRLSAERDKRTAHLAKRGRRADDHHMRRVMTPKGKGTIYSINNDVPTDPEAFDELTASVRLDSDPGGYGGGKVQHRFRLSDLEFIDDDYNILDEEALEEKVVKVPRGLRGEEGSALSSRDAEQFVNSLGPDDVVATEVIDPDTGEVLDWPDQGTRRERNMKQYKRDEKEQRARDEEEHEEGFDSPYLYAPGIDKDPERAFDGIHDLKYDREFTDFYHIVWRQIEDLVDEPEQYYEGDYDIGYEIPVAIKRKDGKKFNKQDRKNFDMINKLFRAATFNIGVQYVGSSDEGLVARFIPSFH